MGVFAVWSSDILQRINEAAAQQTFRDLSKEVVERFLQTVVVLDDGAFMKPPAEVGVPREPDEDAPILEEGPEAIAPAPEIPDPISCPLDAQALITNFAARGLVCAVLAPWSDGDGSAATISASRRADIVILDWQLGDEGAQATGIIRQLIENDAEAGGRLRMIAVYTANPDLEAVRAAVGEVLTNFKATDRPGNILALEAAHTKILFICKGATPALAGRIEEPDLPARLIDEFVNIAKGILANGALGCIAAIREDTHRVLARFHSGMDAPFLTHRILLVTPEDAEDYAVDLLGSEFLAVLEGRMIGSRYAGREAIQLALSELEAQDVVFRLMTAKASAENAQTITVDDLMKLVDAGPAGLAEIPNVSGGAFPISRSSV